MAPSHLQGLNLLHRQPQAGTNSNDLLSGATGSFPDLAAQLELWTNLPFDSEDPSFPPSGATGSKSDLSADEDNIDDNNMSPEAARLAAIRDGHSNVVTATPVSSIGNVSTHTQSSSLDSGAPPPLDLTAILAGFMGGHNNFSQYQQEQQQQQPQQGQPNPTLSQLLALAPQSQEQQQQTPQLPSGTIRSAPPTSSSDERPTKRARASTDDTSRRGSISGDTSSISVSPSPSASLLPSASPIIAQEPADGINATEDKRRRNTAASARFRLKKKEREAALENRAKELENKVSELEKECEGLRRENGWLKGLVVGVTGAQQAGGNAPRK